MARRVILYLRDPVVRERLVALAARFDLEMETDDADGPDPTHREPPAAAFVELELPGAVDRIAGWRARWPDALLAGSIGVPDQELWHGALAAGADLVANRGAFVPSLARAFEARASSPSQAVQTPRLPVRLMERLGDGLVGRLPDAPGGAIAVFRIGERLHAIRDECPHAGASLADGPLAGRVITCPRHGSQFDVPTGARERGPSDFAIRTYRVVTVDGATFVEIPS